MPSLNMLLATLPAAEWLNIRNACTIVEVHKGQVLWEAEEKGKFIYFPIDSLISLMYESGDGDSIAVATIGRHGIAGTSIVMGLKTPDRAVVSYTGTAYQMGSGVVRKELSECGDFQDLLMTYNQGLLTQIALNAICYRLHRVDQHLCRLFLEMNDELQTETFFVTHAQIANLLGVRRESVSLGLTNLSKQGVIGTSRGKVAIANLKKLNSIVCECHEVVVECRDRILNKYKAEHRN
ncbi:MAG: Crp/Fnr family transcriptional regulator [Acidobacteria bacterium]|nr:Crp/Fnr family transcriptional regulator [Acidobacteriota bacterium]